MSVNINHQLEQVNNLKITPVGTGATVGTAGIVTYFGDGSQLSGMSGGISNVSEDTTPQLGGDLDLNSNDITGTGNLNITGIATFSNVTIGGTLTYDDVTNIDSVGLVTARSGIEFGTSGAGGTITSTGDATFAGIVTAPAFTGFDYLQAPHGSTVNFTVTVASKTAAHRYNGTGSSNGYVIDGVESPFLTFTPGRTYRFTLSSGDMSSHPFRLYLEADRTTQYTTNVTSTSTYTEIVVTDTTPTVLHYQCSAHEYMGNAVQVNSNKVDTPYQIDGLKGANITGVVTATGFSTTTGTSSQFLKADGSVDSNTYLTSYTETDPVVGAISGIVKADGGGNISAATAGTDYLTPSGDGSNLTGLTGASAATYGSASVTPVIVVDSDGRITGISTVATSGGGGGGISNVVEDTTPQLGGNLDLNSNDITGTGNFNVTGVVTSTTLSLLDNKEIQFGDSQDLKIYHKTNFEKYNEKRLLASDAYGGDEGFPPFIEGYDGGLFGFSVAVSDTKVLIGAPGDAGNSGDNRYGAGYLYSHDGTSEVILSNDSGTLYELGHSVGLGTTVAYVGRIYNENGEVLVFDYSGTQVGIITASDGANIDFFGSAIGVGTSKIVIGAYGDDDNGSESGSAYIFNLDGTSQVKIDASDGEASDRFGYSVGIGGTIVVVGAYQEDTVASNAGKAYIFDLSGNQLGIITASNGAANDYFGFSVDVSSTKIVIGAYNKGSGQGSVYVYDHTGSNETIITASDAANFDNFGYDVAVNESNIFVSAPLDDDSGTNSGSIYVYDLDVSNEIKLTNTTTSEEGFGKAIAVNSSKLVVGAPDADDFDLQAGAAYIFDASPQNTYLDNYTGDLTIRNNVSSDVGGNIILQAKSGENSVVCNDDGSVELYYDNSKKIETISTGATVTGDLYSSSNIFVSDDNGFKAGKSGDLLINHSSTDGIKVVASDAIANDYFGFSVAIGTSKIVIGAVLNDDLAPSAGAAYIYNLDKTDEIKLTASDGGNSDKFGTSVGIGGTIVVVGASQWDGTTQSNCGSFYIFDLSGNQLGLVSASDQGGGDNFGEAVAVGPTKIVSGAPGDASNQGSAYLFDHDGTNQIKLTASDGASSDKFGTSVGIGGTIVVVGAPYDHVGSTVDQGSAYIFDLSGNQLGIITASNGTSNDLFGVSVGVGGTIIVVGARNGNGGVDGSGSVYIYDHQGNQLGIVSASDGAVSDYFGWSVDTDGNKIVVGAYLDDDNGSGSGSLYIYDDKGENEQKVTAFDGIIDGNFGYAVATGAGKIIVGANGDHPNDLSDAGAAYIFNQSVNSSYIENKTGDLIIRNTGSGGNVLLQATSGENSVVCNDNGSVELYYDDTKRLETISTGTTVTGDLYATTLYGDGSNLTGLTGASAATYGNSSATPVITVDSNGRITGISTVATSGAGGGGGISNVVEDTTPQLGGNLDLNSKTINGTGNINITGVVTATEFVGNVTGIASTATTVQATANTNNSFYRIPFLSADTGNVSLYSDSGIKYNPSTNELVAATRQVNLVANNSNDETVYLTFADAATGGQELETDTGLTYNPSSGALTATSFGGSGSNLTGLTGASAATYGDSGATPVIVVDANGRITGISTAAISGGGGGSSSTRTVNRYVATQSQTLFPASGTISYTVGYLDVYLNGSRLDTTEFTATNGTTVTLATGASANDIIELVAFTNLNLANVTVVNDSTPQLGGDLDLNSNDITGTGNINITGTATVTGGQVATQNDAIAFAIALG